MRKNNKRAVLALGISFLCVAVLFAVLAVSVFKTDKTIVLKDNKGEVFAEVKWDGVSEKYTAEDELVKAYASTAFNEAAEIIADKYNVSDEEKKERVFEEVTEIKTNLDKSFLLRLENAAEKQKAGAFSCEMAVTDLNGRLVAVLVSGKTDNPYEVSDNYVGSVIKPLSVFAPAIESGAFNWSSMIKDSPVSEVKDEAGVLTPWPVNSDGEYTYQKETLMDALADSTNTVAVRLLKKIGVNKSILALENNYDLDLSYEKMKVANTDEAEVLGNVALGYLHNGASVIDMAGSFQVFANGGLYTAPTAVDELSNGSETIYKAKYESKRAVSEGTAEILNQMLQRVVKGGTGSEAYISTTKIGGKTGTTSGNEDNWFAGFTPEYSCAVWHSVTPEGNIAPRIFADVFESLDETTGAYPVSRSVISRLYCSKSGKLKGENCTNGELGYYIAANMPDTCDECK